MEIATIHVLQLGHWKCDDTYVEHDEHENMNQLKIDTSLLQMLAEHSGQCFLLEASWD